MLDGVVYRANADLEIEIPSDNELIPFSNVTFFDNDEEYQLKDIKDIASLKKQLDSKVGRIQSINNAFHQDSPILKVLLVGGSRSSKSFRSVDKVVSRAVLYPGSRQVLETNLINMMNYDLPNQTPEWKEKYRAKVKPYFDSLKDETGRIIYDDKGNTILGDLIDRDGLMKFQQEIRDKVKKFSDWADPKHEIKLP